MAFTETQAKSPSRKSVSSDAKASERWLLLTDFASKHRISVSTLRRRIKNGAQDHRFENGKYFLRDSFEVPAPATGAVGASSAANDVHRASPEPAPSAATTMDQKDEPLITTTSNLLNELKQAYTLILHEKEEQIVFLKEEIADLKTLVRVLESENARLVSDRERFERER